MITSGNSSALTADSAGAVTSTVDHAATGAHKAIEQAAGAARPAVESIASGAHQAVDKLASVANQAAEALDAKGGQWKEAQSRFSESCLAQVREKPIAALGIAVAAGFLLSWVMNQRNAAGRNGAYSEPAAR